MIANYYDAKYIVVLKMHEKISSWYQEKVLKNSVVPSRQ